MKKMGPLCMTSMVLMVIGALNWGLIAINPEWNVVALLLGDWPVVARVVYGLVGLAGVYGLVSMFMGCKECK